MARVLVTGASGFVGSVLCRMLSVSGHVVRAALRIEHLPPAGVKEVVVIESVGRATYWEEALAGVDFVIHLAGKVHLKNGSKFCDDEYVETNGRGTQRLASESARAGVRRFVYLSTIKVNGDETTGSAYTPNSAPRPGDAYGQSKWLGEVYLKEIMRASSMEAAVVRSPLVYGPGVRANFRRLLRWVDRGWPLPLAAVRNRRSIVSVWNLCHLLIHLLEHPMASGRTWMVSDDRSISTPELIERIAKAMRRPVRLVAVPTKLLPVLATLAGQRAEIARLCGSLEVDIGRTKLELDWNPLVTLDEGIIRTVAWYLSTGRTCVD